MGDALRSILSMLEDLWTRENDFGRGRILSPSAEGGELAAGEPVLLLAAVLGDGSVEPIPESRLFFAAAEKSIKEFWFSNFFYPERSIKFKINVHFVLPGMSRESWAYGSGGEAVDCVLLEGLFRRLLGVPSGGRGTTNRPLLSCPELDSRDSPPLLKAKSSSLPHPKTNYKMDHSLEINRNPI